MSDRLKLAASVSLLAMTLSLPGAFASEAGDQCAAELSSPVEFRISHQNAPTSPIHPKLEEVVAAVTEETGGKIVLSLYPSAQLGGEMQALEQAALDQNIIFYTTAAALATAGDADFGILNGPFLLESLEQGQKLAKSDLVAELEEKLAAQGGLRVLALNWFDSPRSILSNKGYPTPEELSGVKMRVPEAPAYMRTFELLKTSPLALPFSELYLALQQGVVTAVEGGIRGMADANLMEVANTVTITNHFRLFYGFTMSENLFADLPRACQEVLTTQFQEKGDAYSAGMDAITEQAIADLKASGTVFVEADQAAYRAATADFYTLFPDWSEGLYERVQQALE